MDINVIRVAVTVLGLVLFIALVVHTWSRSRKAEHDAAAMLPFAGEAGEAVAPARQGELK
ncbi:CcoQ/FixQ family Cbb3-type cytochrome c oxidase assembly chaperone [Hydrogenophaga sp.]|uniref:cbb3-type cytochrome oxidase subunit 3 n=1 Tax=Hydrogenophaga sp. TaxID=1904254 RepID=UPI0019FBF951|nr:CcoQ/FixQ family Cbb3-type cytochrome c oxidase assembly chaperone [Hydrogenophaga sp.]MBE0549835.1 CcoQ/FixQ family Cbb3-type cytochrome c oxidase assembly chaperone [Rubrivivax sp.]MDP1686657.1 CcoQ/FixQ family Cbb3-type cytochrome c oxidase assembly chaperone [Hydrogenophaga sp.]